MNSVQKVNNCKSTVVKSKSILREREKWMVYYGIYYKSDFPVFHVLLIDE
jgi:hypothetical protein